MRTAPGPPIRRWVPDTPGVMRVLIVEDQARTAQVIRKGLEQEGYVVDVVIDGAAAISGCLWSRSGTSSFWI